jgi:cytoplasmic iron level regulating protein YaaA (DUF328/UPF0246 family)
MITILSPAKNLDFKSKPVTDIYTLPEFLNKSHSLVKRLRTYSPEGLRELMHINPKLAELNYERFRTWKKDFSPENAKQAVLAFNGEVFNGLKAPELSEDTLIYAQDHLRILSGLYGILRPLDLILPYRLEMGTKLILDKHTDLYSFWGNRLLRHLNSLAKETDSDTLINLASDEYSKAAGIDRFKGRVITPVFKQLKGEKLTTIIVYMKKARGLMTRFILENRIEDPEQLKLFDSEGYFYDDNLSTEIEWVFVR